jgi:hypothetical protein
MAYTTHSARLSKPCGEGISVRHDNQGELEPDGPTAGLNQPQTQEMTS